MASIIKRGPLWLVLLSACDGGDKDQTPIPDSAVEETGVTTPTAETGDPTVDVWPTCEHTGRTEPITLLGANRLDYLGASIDVADVDGDGCEEIAVAATRNFGYYQPGEGAVYLVSSDGLASGNIGDVASATWQEAGTGSWVHRVALVPPQIVWLTTWWEEVDYTITVFNVFAYDLPESPSAVLSGAADRSGDLYIPAGGYAVNTSNDVENCSGIGTPTFCVETANLGSNNDFAGAIWLFDAPLQESRSFLSFRTRIAGDSGDSARTLEADDDLDGDGLDDLVIGASEAAGTGRVGLVSAPPDGEHLLWDITYATLEGAVDGAEAGLGLATGDLDGDGYVDIFVGAPIEDAGYAYVATGPFSGPQSLAEATYRVTGESALQWTGYDGAIGDMNGDGAAELVVGAPYSIYFNSQPGTVALFDAPTAGSYLTSDADITLTSGDIGPDAFGFAMAPGDIDGDGLMDLAIGAPDDSRNGGLAGSLTLVFGASL